MKRILFILVSALLALFFTTTAQASTTFNDAAAPSGTHVQTDMPSCSVSGTTVTCSSYELAGIGNANAQASLAATYTATVQCQNHGGQIVEVKTQPVSTTSTSPVLHADKNGRLTVPVQTSTAPSTADLLANATCPNGNWTKKLLDGSVALAGFTYTLHFVGFTGNYITITGP